jgi:hypothetical protein
MVTLFYGGPLQLRAIPDSGRRMLSAARKDSELVLNRFGVEKREITMVL